MKREKRKTGPYFNLPTDVRLMVLEKVEQLKKEGAHHSNGILTCPRNKEHWCGLAYSMYHGVEQIFCDGCGYHFVLMKKAEGLIELVDARRKEFENEQGEVLSIYDRIKVKERPAIVCNRKGNKRRKR